MGGLCGATAQLAGFLGVHTACVSGRCGQRPLSGGLAGQSTRSTLSTPAACCPGVLTAGGIHAPGVPRSAFQQQACEWDTSEPAGRPTSQSMSSHPSSSPHPPTHPPKNSQNPGPTHPHTCTSRHQTHTNATPHSSSPTRTHTPRHHHPHRLDDQISEMELAGAPGWAVGLFRGWRNFQARLLKTLEDE